MLVDNTNSQLNQFTIKNIFFFHLFFGFIFVGFKYCVTDCWLQFFSGHLDDLLGLPPADGDLYGADLDLLEDADGLLVGQTGHRPSVHRKDFVP